MSNDTFPALIGRALRDFSSQVAISVAASAVAAVVFAFPDMLPSGSGASAGAERSVQAAGDIPFEATQAGKFVQRHRAQIGSADDAAIHALALPATLMMPMSLAWTAPVQAAPELIPVAVLERPAQAVPVARAVPGTSRERSRAQAASAQPLQIAPALQLAAAQVAASPEIRESASVLGVALPDSVTRAGRALGGVVDTVGAAGSWTVSAASNLLPSWGGSAR
jgi:hypothetical protein